MADKKTTPVKFATSNDGAPGLKVALAHDFLIYQGGAERVFREIATLFPQAPIFALLARGTVLDNFRDWEIIPSFLNRVSRVIPHRWLLPFYPIAAESIDLRDYDLIVSSTSSFMKGVVIKPKTIHICYCHAPTRYLWDLSEQYLDDSIASGKLAKQKRFFGRVALNYLRMWDQTAAKRVDYFIANSQFTAQRIKKYYKKKARVIYPPVDLNKFSVAKEPGKYFLVISRMSQYKRIDLVVEAFNRLGWPLVIAGTGREKRNLMKLAGKNIRFLGFVKEEKLIKLYRHARALIFPGEDDFGMTMVEAMASGRPVLAFKAGGALEILEEGRTGEFFGAPEVEVLVDGLRRLVENESEYDPKYIRASVERFSLENFQRNFKQAVDEIMGFEI
jgi:glycosyltransferase involved in cell wall biosynthesis